MLPKGWLRGAGTRWHSSGSRLGFRRCEGCDSLGGKWSGRFGRAKMRGGGERRLREVRLPRTSPRRPAACHIQFASRISHQAPAGQGLALPFRLGYAAGGGGPLRPRCSPPVPHRQQRTPAPPLAGRRAARPPAAVGGGGTSRTWNSRCQSRLPCLRPSQIPPIPSHLQIPSKILRNLHPRPAGLFTRLRDPPAYISFLSVLAPSGPPGSQAAHSRCRVPVLHEGGRADGSSGDPLALHLGGPSCGSLSQILTEKWARRLGFTPAKSGGGVLNPRTKPLIPLSTHCAILQEFIPENPF